MIIHTQTHTQTHTHTATRVHNQPLSESRLLVSFHFALWTRFCAILRLLEVVVFVTNNSDVCY